MKTEIWKNIEGFEGYQVSNLGRVKSYRTDKGNSECILNQWKNRRGYLLVSLYRDAKKVSKSVHRLVLETFCPSFDNNRNQVNHINEIKTDNRLENLEWCTPKENNNYGSRISRAALSLSKPILQMGTEGNVIAEWASSYEAERNTGFRNQSINRCCNGKRNTAYGYKWKFK